MVSKLKLSSLIFFSFILAYDITPMIGTPSIATLNSKKDKGCLVLSFNSIYNFAKVMDEYEATTKNSNITASFLLSSGIEFRAGKYMKIDNIDIEYKGIAYHIRKRKYGVGLHFTSYDHNYKHIYTSKLRETGISLHLGFRKKTIKPFLYYSRTSIYNNKSILYQSLLPNKPVELISFGATNMLNNVVFAIYLTAKLEEVFNLDVESAQLNVTVGVLLN